MSEKQKKKGPSKKIKKAIPVKTEKTKQQVAASKKSSAKKVTTKKPVVKKVAVKKSVSKINEPLAAKVKIKKKTKNVEPKKTVAPKKMADKFLAEIFDVNDNTVKCMHCGKYFDEKLEVCPFCKKTQKDNLGKIVIGVLAVVLLLAIVITNYVDKYNANQISESEYKYNCKFLSYEDLVRKPKKYRGTNVKVIGKIISVSGNDLSYGNSMIIKIDTNLFEDDTKHIMEIQYTDKNYEIGFIEGDLITVYGEYTSINGNTPFIRTKYIAFGS